MTFSDPSSRAYARTAGLLYLIIAIAGGFSIAYVPSQLHVFGDPASTFQNIQTYRGLFNLGIAGDVVMMLAEVIATAMLYFMFRHVNQTLSLAAAFARLSMAVIMGVMLLFHAGSLALIDPTSVATSFSTTQRAELAGIFLQMHDAGVWVWQLFFTLHLAILGWLVVQSGAYPRLLGRMMMIGAFGYLLDSLIAFTGTSIVPLDYLKIILLSTVTLGEIGFALWLLGVGPRLPNTPTNTSTALA